MRTCSEICIDADENKDDLLWLSHLYSEVMKNKKSYPINELRFMIEHLENYAKEIGRRDAKELKIILGL